MRGGPADRAGPRQAPKPAGYQLLPRKEPWSQSQLLERESQLCSYLTSLVSFLSLILFHELREWLVPPPGIAEDRSR